MAVIGHLQGTAGTWRAGPQVPATNDARTVCLVVTTSYARSVASASSRPRWGRAPDRRLCLLPQVTRWAVRRRPERPVQANARRRRASSRKKRSFSTGRPLKIQTTWPRAETIPTAKERIDTLPHATAAVPAIKGRTRRDPETQLSGRPASVFGTRIRVHNAALTPPSASQQTSKGSALAPGGSHG